MQSYKTLSLAALSVGAVACAASVVACKSRNFGERARVKQDEGTFAKLDAMDVSVLFPMPKKGQKDLLLKLDAPAKTSDGALLPEPLFRQVMKTISYDDPAEKDGVDPTKPHKHRSGIVLSEYRKTNKRTRDEDFLFKIGRPKPGVDQDAADADDKNSFLPWDLDQSARWRVMAFRFDPCAPTDAFNRLKHGSSPLPEAFDAAKCKPQMRLTAQPLVDSTDEGYWGEFDDAVRTGDYGMHLVYDLDETSARDLARALSRFKERCGGRTDSEPLAVSRCFASDGDYKLETANLAAFLAIVQGTPVKLARVAFMGTDLTFEPWVFFHGRVEAGTFKHERIEAVRRPGVGTGEPRIDPATGKPATSGPAMARVTFGNGFYQLISFLNRNTDGVGAVTPAGKNEVVTPLPQRNIVKDEIATLLKPDLMGFLNARMEEDAAAPDAEIQGLMTESMRRIRRIENPRLNDVSSSDCVSCHVGTQLERQFGEKAMAFPFLRRFVGELASSENNFVPPAAHLGTVRLENAQRDRYSVLNFAWLGGMPQISRRTAQESALAADMANRSFLGGAKEPIAQCRPAELLQCVNGITALGQSHLSPSVDARVEDDHTARLTRFFEQSCYVEHCSSLAPRMESRNGKVRMLRARKDAVISNRGARADGTLVEPSADRLCRRSTGQAFFVVDGPEVEAAFKAPDAGFRDFKSARNAEGCNNGGFEYVGPGEGVALDPKDWQLL